MLKEVRQVSFLRLVMNLDTYYSGGVSSLWWRDADEDRMTTIKFNIKSEMKQ